MKTSEKTSMYKIRFLIPALVLSLLFLMAGPAMAQVPGKNKKNDKIPQDTLKEAKVVARVTTTVQEITPMRVKLNVLNPTGRAVRVSILNYANLPVYEESFTGKEYNKILNFNYTAAGRYMLRIAGHKQVDIRRFAINGIWNRNLTASPMENLNPTDVMAAIYQHKSDKIILHVVNNTGKPINYVFRGNSKEVLHRGTIKTANFTKLFNLADTRDGNYSFEVNDQSQKAAYRSFALQTVYDRSFAWVDKRGRAIKPVGSSPISFRTTN